MKPLYLKLDNFIGIRDGLGRDSFEIDLAGYEGLVALVGPNGRGKTTVLDNMHPYRLMPSRASSYSPRAFSFYDQTHLKARKEFACEHEGEAYRSIVLIHGGGKSRKQEAYLQIHRASRRVDASLDLSNAEWEPVTLPDGTTSDGKTDTHDACVSSIFGSPELFFSSVFSAQGRGHLSTYRQSDIKGLLSELLGLAEVEALGDRAREVRRGLRARLEAHRSTREDVESTEARLKQARSDQAEKAAEVERLVAAHKKWEEALTRAREDLVREEERAKAAEADIERRRALESELQAAQEATEQEVAKYRAESRDEQQRLSHAHQEALRARDRAAARTQEIRRRIEEKDRLLARESQIRRAAEEVKRLEAEIEKISAQMDEARVARDVRYQAERELQRMQADGQEIKAKGKHLAEKLEDASERSRLIEEVPCVGTEMNQTCQLLGNARDASKRAVQISAEKDEMLQQYEDLKERARTYREEKGLDEADTTESALSDMDETRKDAYAKLTTQRELAADESALKGAKEERGHLETDAAAAAEEQERQDAAIKSAATAEFEAQDRHAKKLHDLQKKGEEQAAKIHAQIEAIPAYDAAALEGAREHVRSAESEAAASDSDLSAAKTAEESARASIRSCEEHLERLACVREEVKTLERELPYWHELSTALSTDGIIALCIDDAGPAISSLANDLLIACFGSRYTVSFKTQSEVKKTGDMKEDFDIVVHDAEGETSKSVRSMSGGQKVYVDEALMKAIALYLAQSSGHRYRTIFTDEMDGALDHEKKLELVAMKREVLRLGGYEGEFFISHTPEVQQMADHQINFGRL